MEKLLFTRFSFALVTLALICSPQKALAQATSIEWAIGAGGATNTDIALGIATDPSRNVYITGQFEGTSTFGNYTLTSLGSHDAFVAKIGPSGNMIWAKQFGGTDLDQGTSIAVDAAGNSYITGHFFGTASFGNFTFTSVGMSDIFTMKLDGAGNVLWAKQGGSIHHDWDRDIVLDALNNVYISGRFQGNASFGTSNLAGKGYDDIYVVKYDSTGNLNWATSFGGTESDVANSIALDPAGNIFITGEFQETVLFGSDTLVSSGWTDVYLAKLDQNGNAIWAKKAGGSSGERVFGVATDSEGNSYITGEMVLTMMFDTVTLTSQGITDAFIARYDAAGNLLWAKNEGSGSQDYGYGITHDKANHFYVIGHFFGTSLIGNTTLVSSGMSDIYIAKYDENGNSVWVSQLGNTEQERGYDISSDLEGNCYFTGTYQGNVSFNQTTTLVSSGYTDLFVAKIGNSPLNLPSPTSTLSIYPNPFATSFQISLSGSTPAMITLTDMLGRHVLQQIATPETGKKTAMVTPSANLPSGLYLLQVKQGETFQQLRIVKQ